MARRGTEAGVKKVSAGLGPLSILLEHGRLKGELIEEFRKQMYGYGAVVDPRQDCEIHCEGHGEDRRTLRGLAYDDLVHVVRDGQWEDRPDGKKDVHLNNWTVRVKVGNCTLSVVTVFPRG